MRLSSFASLWFPFIAACSLFAAPRPLLGAGLVDDPIVGSRVVYLDGAWKATHRLAGPVSSCKYVQDTDYNHGETSEGQAPAANHSECCTLCADRVGCGAGVFWENTCWFKSMADLSKPSHYPGAVACEPERAPGPLLTLSNATVPGDLITDLEMAGMIGDPWYEMNFKNASLWGSGTWNYSTTINLIAEDIQSLARYDADGSDVLLVFDGIKMGARILLNGKLLGEATDQFVRYNFSLGQALSENSSPGLKLHVGENELLVSFDMAIETDGRFMACTGGWDWAPHSTSSVPGYRTFSRGIWKSVYLVSVDAGSAAIEHVVPQIFYTGPYPTEALQPQEHGDFLVNVSVRFYVPRASQGVLSVTGEWGESADQKVSLPAGSGVGQIISLNAAAKNISLWWPAGLGNQSLCTITVSYTPAAPKAVPVETSRKVGFRYIALVTGNDTDPEYVKKASESQTTASMGMFFRVNGVPVFSRGANMIPMEELEGRSNAEAYSRLVQSAVDGRMNMLRVWGGGIYLPNVWYDECDRLGIMVYHDMMYAQGHLPANNPTNEVELRHQISRLSHHPSIVVWDGCNECRVRMNSSTEIYVSFVLKVVIDVDRSRPIWPSCPANGWEHGVHALDATPTGEPLVTQSGRFQLETHGPYQIGSGFMTTDSGSKLNPVSANIPRHYTNQANPSGFDQRNVFASEFGCSVFSSFESMSPSLHPDHWGVHAGMPAETCHKTLCNGTNPMSERNHPCDSVTDAYFGGADDLDQVGELVFKKQLYLCLIAQVLNMKASIETRRSTNQFGVIVWQYNEIWPTGGWGSIEYGTPRAGQVIGGRWKPLHYIYRQTLFTDCIVACGSDGWCYFKSDRVDPHPVSSEVCITSVSISTGEEVPLFRKNITFSDPGRTVWVQVDFQKVNPLKHIIHSYINRSSNSLDCENWNLLTVPQNLSFVTANASVSVGEANPDQTVDINVTVENFALYLTLTTLAPGRFSANAIMVKAPGTVVQFIPFGGLDLSLLKSSLRVEDLSSYL